MVSLPITAAAKSPRFSLLLFAIFAVIGIFTIRHVYSPEALELPSVKSLSDYAPYQISRKPLIPRHIWQTWQTRPNANPAPVPDSSLETLVRTWTGRNPSYTYTRLHTDESLEYVRSRFAHRPDIISIFESATEPVLRADMIRYLVLLADGGIYTDMDTECIKSIDLWSGQYDPRKVGLIVGLEYDQRKDKYTMPGMKYHTQFSQWTVASSKGHPVMQHVANKVFENLGKWKNEHGSFEVKKQTQVFEMTGPSIFSEAIREGLSTHIGERLSFKDFSMLKEPKLFGDVLVLPIDGFASGSPHSGASEWGNEQQLVGHKFKGDWKQGLGEIEGMRRRAFLA